MLVDRIAERAVGDILPCPHSRVGWLAGGPLCFEHDPRLSLAPGRAEMALGKGTVRMRMEWGRHGQRDDLDEHARGRSEPLDETAPKHLFRERRDEVAEECRSIPLGLDVREALGLALRPWVAGRRHRPDPLLRPVVVAAHGMAPEAPHS